MMTLYIQNEGLGFDPFGAAAALYEGAKSRKEGGRQRAHEEEMLGKQLRAMKEMQAFELTKLKLSKLGIPKYLLPSLLIGIPVLFIGTVFLLKKRRPA